MIIKVGGLEPLGPIGVYAYGNISTTAKARAFKICILVSHVKYQLYDA